MQIKFAYKWMRFMYIVQILKYLPNVKPLLASLSCQARPSKTKQLFNPWTLLVVYFALKNLATSLEKNNFHFTFFSVEEFENDRFVNNFWAGACSQQRSSLRPQTVFEVKCANHEISEKDTILLENIIVLFHHIN